MKIKYFLRGLGIGILVTALVLCIGYRKLDSEESVVERARELGMEFPEKTPDSLVEPTATPETVVSGPAAMVTEEPVEEKTEKPTAKPTQKATPKVTAKVTAKATPKPDNTASGKTRTFTVRSGLLSSSVAREMKQAGIIEDDEALDEYLEKSGLARKVRAGKYEIPVGASYEEIARIITRQD